MGTRPIPPYPRSGRLSGTRPIPPYPPQHTLPNIASPSIRRPTRAPGFLHASSSSLHRPNPHGHWYWSLQAGRASLLSDRWRRALARRPSDPPGRERRLRGGWPEPPPRERRRARRHVAPDGCAGRPIPPYLVSEPPPAARPIPPYPNRAESTIPYPPISNTRMGSHVVRRRVLPPTRRRCTRGRDGTCGISRGFFRSVIAASLGCSA